MTHTNSQSPEGIFRVNVRLKKHKTQGQMLADFSEAVIAKRQAENLALPPPPEGFFPYCFETGGPVYIIPQGFIPHDGGPRPVADGTKGAILCRGKEKPYLYTPSRLDSVHWDHGGCEYDIIAYRIERSPDFKVEAGKFYITASGERVGPMIGAVYKWINGRFSNSDPEWENNGSRRRNTDSDLLALAADQASPMVSA